MRALPFSPSTVFPATAVPRPARFAIVFVVIARDLVQLALERLAQRSGFSARDGQVQLAYLLEEAMSGDQRGLYEAPTGLGKSLAILIAGLAHAKANEKRVVVATYTNLLTEQYWRKDLPTALSLFDAPPTAAMLIGRQRYACRLAMDEVGGTRMDQFADVADQGTETEFRRFAGDRTKNAYELWAKIQVPPVCPGRACPAYDDCFFYQARQRAVAASVVVTNHSVVIQDALMKGAEGEGDGLLGPYDYLVLDEAHDFPSAAANGLETILSAARLRALEGIAARMEKIIVAQLDRYPVTRQDRSFARFTREIQDAIDALNRRDTPLVQPGILQVVPESYADRPAIVDGKSPSPDEPIRVLSTRIGQATRDYLDALRERLEVVEPWEPDIAQRLMPQIANYRLYVQSAGTSFEHLFPTDGVAVTHAGEQFRELFVRHDLVDFAPTLHELIWQHRPYAAVSATLQLDGSFEHYQRITGMRPDVAEALPSPFDFARQACVYLPRDGAVPDPSVARANQAERQYQVAVADQLAEIIEACDGRTLALFSSRAEMEAVFELVIHRTELPVLMQPRSGAGAVGEQFKAEPMTSLFALRSYWTGFDAPGETLSCVVLVRVPFDVPTEATARVRVTHLAETGLDPFRDYTLANAKLLMRQGAGRLVRRTEDRGIIAILDPRIRTKRYGAEILDNLPPEMPQFRDIADAVGHVGLPPLRGF